MIGGSGLIVGLTGGIACGKSTVAEMFAARGAHLIDADRVARMVVEPGSEGLRSVVERFGSDMLDETGSLDRKKLGAVVFSDEKARADLNQILHPLIRKEMDRQKTEAMAKNDGRLIIMDIPLLFESNRSHEFDKVIVVAVQPEQQLERLQKRDGSTREEALQRIRAQMPLEEKKALADYVIDNSGTLSETAKQVDKLVQMLSGGCA